ncbi:MAG TPA: FdtA/QdtA family cupin domain-containing protein [Flavobacteriales bacterium]|nr:FdtA/QdtA family cupin domain-containing protein [Flavobacteriales bacterium]
MRTTTIADLKLLRLRQHARADGVLTVIPDDGPEGLGIPVRRVFTVTDVPTGGRRGDHAHRDCTQVVVCLRGQASIRIDDGRDLTRVDLDKPDQALSIPPGLWNQLTFAGPDTVIAVFCDLPYAEEDYMRDRNAYKAYKRGE